MLLAYSIPNINVATEMNCFLLFYWLVAVHLLQKLNGEI